MARKFYVLSEDEREELFRQDPSTARDGGFQKFIIAFQGQYRKGTQEIGLDEDDIDRIRKYAADAKQGGFQGRILKIFGRVLELESPA